MEFLTHELDDPESRPCGQCAICSGPFISAAADADLVRDVVGFLRRAYLTIEPRKKWPNGKNIPRPLLAEQGRALCYFGDAGWGRLVRDGKYAHERFAEELVASSAAMIRDIWCPEPAPMWVTAVPSLRRPRLVADLAARLASALGLPVVEALSKTRETPEQKTMENSAHQAGNVEGAFAMVEGRVLPGPVLLVDDLVDSRWTLTECARVLREGGSGPVLPFALANSATTDTEG